MPPTIADINTRLRAAVPPDRLLVHDDIVDPDDMTFADRPAFNDGIHPGDRGMRKWGCDAATRLGLVDDGGHDCIPGPSMLRTVDRVLAVIARGELSDRMRTWAAGTLEATHQNLIAATTASAPRGVHRELREAHRLVRKAAERLHIADAARAFGEDERRLLRVLLEPLAAELGTLRRSVVR